MIVAYLVQAGTGFLLDLSVFRDAGVAFTKGLPLYSEDFPSTSGFRFIYAPFAAIVFAPLAWVQPTVLQVLWSVLNAALLWWILRVLLVRLGVGRAPLVAAAALGVALLLEPVRSNFGFGQINIVLMAVVVADCAGALPRRLRGIGIGVAAAIKITPAAFGLVLLVRRDLRSITRAVATVAATAGIGFWLLPQASIWFWATEFFRSDRAGGHDFSRNQAVTGLLARWGASGLVKDLLWLISAVVIVAAAGWAARRFTASGDHVVALGVVALAALLAAPFAVSHHWVYCVLLIPLALAPQYRRWRPLLTWALVIFLIGPHFALTGEPSGWAEAVWAQVAGNAQCLAALALLAAAVLAAHRRGAAATPTPLTPARTQNTPAAR
nr:glycosyltransferase family 87 protein [Rhodococcus opacus]